MIKGRYKIADCEHRGDIENAINYVKGLGCVITNTYWDGHDCGDAYVEFTCGAEVVKKLYKSISFSFECNIADYVDYREQAITELKNSRYIVVSGEKYNSIREKYVKNYDFGFVRDFPIELTFEMEEYDTYNTPYNKVYGFMCHNTHNMLKVVCCKIEGDKYTFLILCDFDNVINALDLIEGKVRACEVKLIHETFVNEFGDIDIRKIGFWDYYDYETKLYEMAYGEDAC